MRPYSFPLKTLAFKAVAAGGFALAVMAGAAGQAKADTLTLFSAVSTTNAMKEIIAAYKKAGGDIRVSFGATSTLAKQIENGAPADIFLSADNKWMDRLQKAGFIKNETRVSVVANSLSLVKPKGSDFPMIKIEKNMKLFEALKGKRLAVGDTDHTAVGLYFKDAAKYLGIWKEIEPTLAMAPSVRAGLSMVERGEVGAGIVFKTSGLVSDKVEIVGDFPQDSHGPITYPIAVVKTSNNPDTAKFYAFLKTEPAKAAFSKYGFKPILE
jgi:molybdate transport system substrate-binding protein